MSHISATCSAQSPVDPPHHPVEPCPLLLRGRERHDRGQWGHVRMTPSELLQGLARNARVGLMLFPRCGLKYLYDVSIQIDTTKYSST